MKVKVNIPLHFSREYLDDFDPNTIPDVGDYFSEIYGHEYIVENKIIIDNECILDIRRKDFYEKYKMEMR